MIIYKDFILQMAKNNSLLYNKEFNFLVNDNQVLFKILNDNIIEILHSDKIVNSLKIRLDIVRKFIEVSLKKYNFNLTLDVIFNLDDFTCDVSVTEFGFSKKINVTNPLVPNLYAMMNYSNLDIFNDDKQITQKIKKGIFVGSTTGDFNPNKNKRLLYCNHFLNSEICDFYISNIVQIDNRYVYETFPDIRKNIGKMCSKRHQLNYKYIIDLDGNTTSWDRIKWVMGSNSLLLKEVSDNIEWYYPILKHQDNILFFNNMDDLKNLILNLNLEDESYLNSINDKSNHLSKNFLTLDVHSYYFVNLLKFIMELY